MIGKTLAHYEITSLLGKGGMGEVYQAKDQKLGRDVAIKILPTEFAMDADRIARFQREAKLLASLNHSNIAAIYGLEESEGTNLLVMELIEGDTLADRIKTGPIPFEEALKLALQIAEALETAHDKGVIHRDLKPANIKVTPEGKVKVLDFGLAKAFAEDQGEVKPLDSPTLSAAATRQGYILGTAAYMSPEQARGKTVDRRTDIWAFGCVLYEMLTGQVAFQGEDVTEVLAAVVKSEVNNDLLPANIHFRARELLSRCLQKESKKRYSGINDVQYEIEQVLADPKGLLIQPTTGATTNAKLRNTLPWIAAAIVLIAAIAGVAVWKLKPPEPKQVMRFEYTLPENQQISGNWPIAVSPDGKQFVYSTTNGLYMHTIGELTAELIDGTEGNTEQPFFSPDGKWIGYFSVTDQQLKKILVTGGTPVPLCSLPQLGGASWYEDNTIVYGKSIWEIMRISANGGTPESLVKVKSGFVIMPQILPDNKSLLYTLFDNLSQCKIMVKSFNSGESKELFSGRFARYVSTGYIIYSQPGNNSIFCVPFDPERLEVTGAAIPIIKSASDSAYSGSGTFAYISERPGASYENERTLVWVDRKGNEEPISALPNGYHFPNISPDGTKVVITNYIGENGVISLWDFIRKTLTPLTFEDANNIAPVWSPDGKRIAFYSLGLMIGGKDASGVYWKAADGTGKNEQFGSTDRMFFPYCWLRDGKTLLGTETLDLQSYDISTLSLEASQTEKLLRRESGAVAQPKISPDGLWMAYMSSESGKYEIYVRPFPDVDSGEWKVSSDGGDSPLWSPDGTELFYLNGEAVMAASVQTHPSFSLVGTPKILFRGKYISAFPADGTPWDINPIDKRFLMIKPPGATASKPKAEEGTAAPQPKIVVVLNWFKELKEKVPVK